MRMKTISPSQIAAILLGIAMGMAVFGYALFFLSPHEAAANPVLWVLSALTTLVVALPGIIRTGQQLRLSR